VGGANQGLRGPESRSSPQISLRRIEQSDIDQVGQEFDTNRREAVLDAEGEAAKRSFNQSLRGRSRPAMACAALTSRAKTKGARVD